ncbi:ABC transporter ATP-binding protein [Nocardia panacis]|uniref:ABC-type quaternary amine transporter n=1 Tax=Nocardia panacis TaxID=2340916 RepID=A0A3A4KR23_9NOCA|nr:ABC transporter ATP-binding protein [Nocardia panacis]RJO72327.1 ABC transporter ATP-binding protein [Nocardia panacis]
MSRLVVAGISKNFGSTRVLDGIDLEVPDGTATAVVGSSGCGKTTLLRVIAGFEYPDAGSVAIGARTVSDERRTVPPQRRRVGYVAQDGALFPHLTVGQNIAYGLGGGPFAARRTSGRVRELLEMVSLDRDFAARRPHQLSGGQQQRVALARALARQPEVMLLDEPFSALDAGLRATTREAVAQTLRAAGMTSILVTHDQEEALSFAEQVAVLRDGHFTQVGAPQLVYAAPADLYTARFLGECVLLDAMVRDATAECALGTVPVRPGGPTGRVTLMLRPEQLVAHVVSDSDKSSGAIREVTFRGPDALLTIAVEGAETVRVRRASAEAPEPGDRVRLEVLGSAVAYS